MHEYDLEVIRKRFSYIFALRNRRWKNSSVNLYNIRLPIKSLIEKENNIFYKNPLINRINYTVTKYDSVVSQVKRSNFSFLIKN